LRLHVLRRGSGVPAGLQVARNVIRWPGTERRTNRLSRGVRSMSLRFISLFLAGALVACGSAGVDPAEEIVHGDPKFVRVLALYVENISAHGEARSHNMGLNCMNCHQEHGPGKGRFMLAGTVHGANGAILPGGTVELRTAANGQGDLVVAVEV